MGKTAVTRRFLVGVGDGHGHADGAIDFAEAVSSTGTDAPVPAMAAGGHEGLSMDRTERGRREYLALMGSPPEEALAQVRVRSPQMYAAPAGLGVYGVGVSAWAVMASLICTRIRCCSPVSASNTRCRTAATWPGAASVSFCRPFAVSWARLLRLSVGHGMRRTQPDFPSHAIAWDRRLCDQPRLRARSLMRSASSVCSDRATRTS